MQLLDDAEAFTGGEVRKAVISVPAYFNVKQREATVNAGGWVHDDPCHCATPRDWVRPYPCVLWWQLL